MRCDFCEYRHRNGYEEPCLHCAECGASYAEDIPYELTDNSKPSTGYSEEAFALAYINEFCVSEYGNNADFTDLSRIGLAYTDLTTEDGRYYEVQVYADLINFRIVTEYSGDDDRTESVQYKSLADMNDLALTPLCFDELISGIFEYEYMEE